MLSALTGDWNETLEQIQGCCPSVYMKE